MEQEIKILVNKKVQVQLLMNSLIVNCSNIPTITFFDDDKRITADLLQQFNTLKTMYQTEIDAIDNEIFILNNNRIV